MASVRETQWVVTLDGNLKEASADAVNALKSLSSEYEDNKAKIAQLNSALKGAGKGNAELSKSIKDQIATFKARQAVISTEAAKHGHSVQTIIKNARKEAAEREKLAKKITEAEKQKAATTTKAYSMLGGRFGAMRNKYAELREIAGKEGGKAALLKAGLSGAASAAAGLAVSASAAAVAVGVGLVVGIAAATTSLTKWVITAANARQQSKLQMEAWVRTGANAANLADQVDELGKKVPKSTEELSKLAIQLRQQGMRGAPLVDSLNAVGQASAALGDEAAGKIQNFITRYQRMGMMQINPFEMVGSGLSFDDVAGALAKQMGVSIEKARAALATGQVKLSDGAKAMRKAIEDKFGGLNLRKMSDLSTVSEQFGKRLSALTKDVNLEPISKFLDRIYKSLDESSVVGQSLKTLFEGLAQAFGTSLDKNGDWIEYGLKESVVWALELATDVVLLKNKIEDAFTKGRTAAEAFEMVLDGIKGTLELIGGVALTGVTGGLFGTDMIEESGQRIGALVMGKSRKKAFEDAGIPLPAHASGGVVKSISDGIANTAPLPAKGEGLASIGVGEVIIPADKVRGSSPAPTITIGDVIVQSEASDPAEVAKDVMDGIVNKIVEALELSNSQLGVT